MAESAIEISDLVVVRGGRRVLDSLTFSVPSGSVTGLIGPSGSGKTTLMRCIVGVQVIRSGRVTVLGEQAGAIGLRQRVGYMTQAPSIYEDLSVLENARYFGAIAAVSQAEADAAIAEVGLTDAARQLVSTLSGGQRARASLACTLIGRPEVLVLDEPTVGQDPLRRRELWHHFHSLADQGATLLVSSHVMDEASRCDRLLLLRNGRLIADDTPDGVRRAGGSDDLDQAFLQLVMASNDVEA